MKGLRTSREQKGFTIIELVVVILLLGILTATALPRFISVENQAHDAVVQGVQTGLITSSGLFRAQWYAEGQPGTVAGYDNHRASPVGYPMGFGVKTVMDSIEDVADCTGIYSSMLQAAGRPTIGIGSASSGSYSPSSTTGSSTDFAVFLNKTNTTTRKRCYYIYTGQFNSSAAADDHNPVLIYDSADGSVTLNSTLITP